MGSLTQLCSVRIPSPLGGLGRGEGNSSVPELMVGFSASGIQALQRFHCKGIQSCCSLSGAALDVRVQHNQLPSLGHSLSKTPLWSRWEMSLTAALCCLCPGGRATASAGAGGHRPEAEENKEGFLSKLKKMFTS